MCGLLGIAVHERLDAETKAMVPYLADQLLFNNNQRGGDSYSLCLVSPAGLHTFKGMGDFRFRSTTQRRWLVMRKLLTDWLQTQPWIWLMGHNRKATHGKVTLRNQHPFHINGRDGDKHEWIVGAHNGVFSSHDLLADDWKIERSVVDSETILKAILAKGEQEALGVCHAHSSMALSYCLDTTEELTLVRGDRPLSVMAADYMVAWSSESGHLEHPFIGLNTKTTRELAYVLSGTARQDKTGCRMIKIQHEADRLTCNVSDEIKEIYAIDERQHQWQGYRGYHGYDYWGPELKVTKSSKPSKNNMSYLGTDTMVTCKSCNDKVPAVLAHKHECLDCYTWNVMTDEAMAPPTVSVS